MADEQYRWLDRDAAERLLNGEPPKAVDPGTRDQVDRLAAALGALAAEPEPTSDELPGEAAALAAFRKARADGDGAAAQLGHRRARSGAHAADAGLVRIGRPAAHGRRTRWGRPTRFGLAAVLAVGMLGGVAVAAGTGVLPTPFTREHPGPAATVTAVRTPDRPLVSPSPSPGVSGGNGAVVPVPDGPSGAPSEDASSSAGPDYASGLPRPDDTGSADRTREWWARTRSYCRDILDGKDLDADRRRVLEHVAGGGARVRLYCSGVLGRGSGGGTGDGSDDGGEQGSGHGSGQGDQGDSGGGDDDGHHIGPGGNHLRDNGVSAPSVLRPGLAPLLPVAPTRPPLPRSTPRSTPGPSAGTSS
ncbi:hypothetical protein [Streptomyces sp. NBC_00151]|uniref:hypothetical protein n=1 Tax=Streptomyces sp. NBC_00151 TaxID=2975669 RepID=UPI002DDAD07A|nr:hypothetical protein [Streptomyces sp. NBC_00151]WRZ39836.1 hypothetical protein OG915_18365 [Streptomyces sp. NBC_00151]